MTFIVDTNVILVANGQHQDVSPPCVAACALKLQSIMTGDLPEALRASHAKPWAQCATDAERLDVFNGFLLTAHLDALFDQGLLTFADDGTAIISKRLTSEQATLLGLTGDEPVRLRWVSPAHLPYLAWHREQVFRF